MGFHFNQKFSAVVSRTRLRVFTSLYFSSLSNDGRAVCSSGAKKVFLVLDTSKCLPHSRLGQSPEGLGGGRSRGLAGGEPQGSTVWEVLVPSSRDGERVGKGAEVGLGYLPGAHRLLAFRSERNFRTKESGRNVRLFSIRG